jgi:hypothetical protein
MKQPIQTFAPMLDESGDRARVIDAAINGRPVPLSDVTARNPGAYLMLYRGDLELLAPLRRPGGRHSTGSIAEDGGYPIYGGSAIQLRDRFSRHIRRLTPVKSLPPDDLLAVPLPTQTWDGAIYVERLILSAFDLLLNQSWLAGFGSREQGRSREKHQKVAPFNVLFPGRPGCHGPAIVTADDLAKKVTAHLLAVPAIFQTALHGMADDRLAPVVPIHRSV